MGLRQSVMGPTIETGEKLCILLFFSRKTRYQSENVDLYIIFKPFQLWYLILREQKTKTLQWSEQKIFNDRNN